MAESTKESRLLAYLTQLTDEEEPKHLVAHIIAAGGIQVSPYSFYEWQLFNFKDLEVEFLKICPSYSEEFPWESKSVAVDYAVKMLYIIGPKYRQLKRLDDDMLWKFRFKNKSDEGGGLIGTISVGTFKNCSAPSRPPAFKDLKMILTVEQASLLALSIFSSIALPCFKHNLIIMTPLARAFFSKDDMAKIASEIHDREPTAEEICEVIVTVIQSCHSGGHHLEKSSSAVACLAAVVATRYIYDKLLGDEIVMNTYSQYSIEKKPFIWEDYVRYAKYIKGGVSTDEKPDWLRRVELYG